MPRVIKKDLEAMVARLTKENSELKNEVEELKKLVDDDGVFKWGVNKADFTEWFTDEHGVLPSVDRYSQFVMEFNMMKTYDICELLQNGAMEFISDMNSGEEKGECNDCLGESGAEMAGDGSGLCIDCRDGEEDSDDSDDSDVEDKSSRKPLPIMLSIDKPRTCSGCGKKGNARINGFIIDKEGEWYCEDPCYTALKDKYRGADQPAADDESNSDDSDESDVEEEEDAKAIIKEEHVKTGTKDCEGNA